MINFGDTVNDRTLHIKLQEKLEYLLFSSLSLCQEITIP